ncbi:hypothetical protein UFOVP168_51 [uncultured Caudovirales phage]|uniref:DUF5681 domain-containing protein n=1 Tax=uncultured Caudovirales phage TaxID=2100421 RepID=A0A6J7WC49_9CAUD|nr:hypothetical protein UFOVP168_51 [uncultured Caudovirales phage]
MDAQLPTAAPQQSPPASPARKAHLFQKGVSANPAGRKPGSTNKVTASIREAIETACAPGACHPQGLAGWLIERAQSDNVQDRAIFAGLVSKALPAQLQASVQHGGVVVQLGWLQHRGVGRSTLTAQSDIADAQVIDSQGLLTHDHRVLNPISASQTPHPPQNPAAGGTAK